MYILKEHFVLPKPEDQRLISTQTEFLYNFVYFNFDILIITIIVF